MAADGCTLYGCLLLLSPSVSYNIFPSKPDAQCLDEMRPDFSKFGTVSSVVEHSSVNPKVPSSILIPGSWIMMRCVSCILLLEWSTTSQRLWVYRISVPYAQKNPRFLFEKKRGQPREFRSLVSTIDGSTLPQDCVEDLALCGTRSNW